jgi:hypothetical protein
VRAVTWRRTASWGRRGRHTRHLPLRSPAFCEARGAPSRCRGRRASRPVRRLQAATWPACRGCSARRGGRRARPHKCRAAVAWSAWARLGPPVKAGSRRSSSMGPRAQRGAAAPGPRQGRRTSAAAAEPGAAMPSPAAPGAHVRVVTLAEELASSPAPAALCALAAAYLPHVALAARPAGRVARPLGRRTAVQRWVAAAEACPTGAHQARAACALRGRRAPAQLPATAKSRWAGRRRWTQGRPASRKRRRMHRWRSLARPGDIPQRLTPWLREASRRMDAARPRASPLRMRPPSSCTRPSPKGRLHAYTTPLHSWFTAAMPRSAYVCVLPTVLPALAWPRTAPRRSGELIMHGTAMLYLLAACTGRHVLCALHILVEQRRGPARLAQLSWPSCGAPGYPSPLHGVSGLWVDLVVLLHALHARQPLHWAAPTALVSSWRSELFSPGRPTGSRPRCTLGARPALASPPQPIPRSPPPWPP